MNLNHINLAYFSATFTTRKIAQAAASVLSDNITEYDFTNCPVSHVVNCESDGELFIIAAPVYSGRIPSQAVEAIRKFKGKMTPAILIAVYGNRDYDDALIELYDCAVNSGFKPIAAGAFIARHCIFPTVATNRPDADDIKKVEEFAEKCGKIISEINDFSSVPELALKGNRPYKTPGKPVFAPIGDPQKCTGCGTCANACPAGAIPINSPCETDAEKCIACGRCIVVCPADARNFNGPVYEEKSKMFTAAFSARKEPEIFTI